MMPTNFECRLYFSHSGSNKEYHAKMHQIDAEKNLWIVDAAYGPRWNVSNYACKVDPDGVSYETAKKEFVKLLTVKIKKGYNTDESGAKTESTDYKGMIAHIILMFQHEELLKAAPPKRRRSL